MLGAVGGSALLLASLLGEWMRTALGSYNAFASDLPWAVTGGSYEIVDGIITAGTAGQLAHGWLLAGLAVLAAACLAVWHQRWAGGLLAAIGAVGTLVVILDVFALRSGLEGLSAAASIGWGPIAAIAASLLLLVSGAGRHREIANDHS